jgi:hypothetical protein
MRRLASEVDGDPGAASDAMTTTTSHPTPDTRLIASSGAVEGEPRSSGKRRVCSKSLPLPRGSGGFARPAGVLAHSPDSGTRDRPPRAAPYPCPATPRDRSAGESARGSVPPTLKEASSPKCSSMRRPPAVAGHRAPTASGALVRSSSSPSSSTSAGSTTTACTKPSATHRRHGGPLRSLVETASSILPDRGGESRA